MNMLVFVRAAFVSFAPPTAAPVDLVSPAATFELTLERTTTGWSATCASGCAWSTVSMSCASGCQAVITTSGIQTQRSPELAKEPFAFVVQRTRGGWQATALGGTVWTDLGWGCAEGSCVARITEHGVFPK